MPKTFENKTPCPHANTEPDQPDCQYQCSKKISSIYENDYRVEGRNSGKSHDHHKGQNPK